jgi:hypothetical protein
VARRGRLHHPTTRECERANTFTIVHRSYHTSRSPLQWSPQRATTSAPSLSILYRSLSSTDLSLSRCVMRGLLATHAILVLPLLRAQVSVVHRDTKTIRQHSAPGSTRWARANASAERAGSSAVGVAVGGGLRNALLARWPAAMNASGNPNDVHHRLHRTRCWGIVNASAAAASASVERTTRKATMKVLPAAPRAANASALAQPLRRRSAEARAMGTRRATARVAG